MNYFSGMVDWRKALSFVSTQDNLRKTYCNGEFVKKIDVFIGNIQ